MEFSSTPLLSTPSKLGPNELPILGGRGSKDPMNEGLEAFGLMFRDPKP